MRVPFGKLDKGKTYIYPRWVLAWADKKHHYMERQFNRLKFSTDNRTMWFRLPLSLPSRIARTFLLGFNQVVSYMFVGIARQAFVPLMLVVKARTQSRLGCPVKEHIQTTSNLPTWSDVYDCSTEIQKRGYSSRLAGVSFRVSPKLKTGSFYPFQSVV